MNKLKIYRNNKRRKSLTIIKKQKLFRLNRNRKRKFFLRFMIKLSKTRRNITKSKMKKKNIR